ncbi:hypothetical protein ACFRDV_32550 [Streptomyces fagopyri]|uniref:hypothetical protein n=1 Tax=Streptomyces fagopyri TaxID=2662397 RepID=UPI0036B52CE7
MQQNCIPVVGIHDSSLFDGQAFTKSFQARYDTFKQPRDVCLARLEFPLVYEEDHLGKVFVGESQIAMNECKILSRAQQILTAA